MPSTKKVKSSDLPQNRLHTPGKNKKKLTDPKPLPSQLSEEDLELIKNHIQKLIKLRKIFDRKQLYEDMGIIYSNIQESIQFGTLKVKGKFTKELILDIICKTF